ncbi:hypothetical protein E2C01_066686 [Portunus trituberculatus]|jgi:hypothetical protein
MVPL